MKDPMAEVGAFWVEREEREEGGEGASWGAWLLIWHQPREACELCGESLGSVEFLSPLAQGEVWGAEGGRNRGGAAVVTDGPARNAPASQNVERMGLDVIYTQFAEQREGLSDLVCAAHGRVNCHRCWKSGLVRLGEAL